MNTINIETGLLKKALFELKYSYKKGAKTLPILEDVFVLVKKDFLFLKLFDLELETTVKIPLKSDFEISFTLNYETFKMFVSKSIALLTTIQIDEKNAQIICGTNNLTLPLGNAEDYPVANIKGEKELFVDELSDFKDSLNKASIFAGNDELRPIMSGINVKGDKKSGVVKIASTDSHKLYYNEVKRELKADFDFVLTLNTSKLISSINSTINFSVSDNNISGIYETESYTVRFISILIQGKYPNYEAVIPKDNDIVFEMNKKELLQKLDVVSLTKNINGSIRIEFEDQLMTITSNNNDFGQSTKVSLDLTSVENLDNTFTIGYNIAFLQMIIKSIDNDLVKLKALNPTTASLFSSSVEDSKELFLLMPVMLNT